MQPDKIPMWASEKLAGGLVRRPYETLLVERHDAVEAPLDDTAHQKVKSLQLVTLIQGDVDVVLDPLSGEN
jgi:hypothetical protein